MSCSYMGTLRVECIVPIREHTLIHYALFTVLAVVLHCYYFIMLHHSGASNKLIMHTKNRFSTSKIVKTTKSKSQSSQQTVQLCQCRVENETFSATATWSTVTIYFSFYVNGILQNTQFLCHSADEHHTFHTWYEYWPDVYDNALEGNSFGDVQLHQNVSSQAVVDVDSHQSESLVRSFRSSASTVLFHEGMSNDPFYVCRWCSVVAKLPLQTHWQRSEKVATTIVSPRMMGLNAASNLSIWSTPPIPSSYRLTRCGCLTAT